MLYVGAHTWVKCDLFKDQKCHARVASLGHNYKSSSYCSYSLPFPVFKCSEDFEAPTY